MPDKTLDAARYRVSGTHCRPDAPIRFVAALLALLLAVAVVSLLVSLASPSTASAPARHVAALVSGEALR